jgi:hypothetical protein
MTYRHMNDDEIEALKHTIIDAIEPFSPFGSERHPLNRELLRYAMGEPSQYFLEVLLLALNSGRAHIDDVEMQCHDLKHLDDAPRC